MKSWKDDACLQSTDERKARIRRLNDSLRKGRGKGELLVTPGWSISRTARCQISSPC